MTNRARIPAFVLILSIAIAAAGCSYPRAKGTLISAGQIGPQEEIHIFWDVGNFSDQNVQQVIAREGTYSRRYELCTNEFFEKTFRRNGYTASITKVRKAEFDQTSSTAPYVLVLHNSTASYQYREPGGVVLHVTGTLYHRASGKALWSVKNWLSTKADVNSTPALHLVRALAEDGLLHVKLEQVVDYDGVLSVTYRGQSKCQIP